MVGAGPITVAAGAVLGMVGSQSTATNTETDTRTSTELQTSTQTVAPTRDDRNNGNDGPGNNNSGPGIKTAAPAPTADPATRTELSKAADDPPTAAEEGPGGLRSVLSGL